MPRTRDRGVDGGGERPYVVDLTTTADVSQRQTVMATSTEEAIAKATEDAKNHVWSIDEISCDVYGWARPEQK